MKKGSCLPIVFSQVIYSGGYSDGEPPLPIPNREAKPVIADGTARPGGRVGSRRAWKESSDEKSSGDSFSCLLVCAKCHAGHSGSCGWRMWPASLLPLRSKSCTCPRHLSTPPVHAGVAAACPCGRTLRSWSDVFPCGTAVRGLRTGVFVLVVPALCPRV